MDKPGDNPSVIGCLGEENKNPLHFSMSAQYLYQKLFLNLMKRLFSMYKFNSDAANSRITLRIATFWQQGSELTEELEELAESANQQSAIRE